MMDLENVVEARGYAFKLLSQYLRTEFEIRQKLNKKGYSDLVVDEVIIGLKSENLIDDREYALEWLRNRMVTKPCGRLICFKKLRERGVDTEIIEEVLSEKYSHEQEENNAVKLGERKFADLKRSGKNNIKQKAAFYLKNKGFGSDIVYKVLERF